MGGGRLTCLSPTGKARADLAGHVGLIGTLVFRQGQMGPSGEYEQKGVMKVPEGRAEALLLPVLLSLPSMGPGT